MMGRNSTLLEGDEGAVEHIELQPLSLSDSSEAEKKNLAEPETVLEDVSDSLRRLSMLCDIRDILNDMIWFYNEFPEDGKLNISGNGPNSSGDLESERKALMEIQIMGKLLDAMVPSLSYVLSSLSQAERHCVSTPNVFERRINSITMIKTIGNPPSEIKSINEKLSQANKYLCNIKGYLHPRSLTDQGTDQGEDNQEVSARLKNIFVEDVPLWNIKETFKGDNISFLLFEEEKVRMEAILDAGLDPRMHWGSIAAPFTYVSEEEETAAFKAIKTGDLLPICLKAIDFQEKNEETPSEWKGRFKACMILTDIVLYIINILTDIIAGTSYLKRKDYVFGILTLLCLILPIFAELVSKFILKVFKWRRKFGVRRWRDILPYDFFEVLPRMARNLVYNRKANETHNELDKAYSELHYYRCIKGQLKFKADVLRNDSRKIRDLCNAFSICHEILIDQSLLAETLYENAPQLLIQFVALGQQKSGLSTHFSIVASLLSMSYTMHKAHKNIHRSSTAALWKDDFNIFAKILETLAYYLIYLFRIMYFGVVFTNNPKWTTMAACTYLLLLYFYLTWFSGRAALYRKLHGYKTTVLWPLCRLYTIPHTVGIWRMDSMDHLLFFLETLLLSASYFLYDYISTFLGNNSRTDRSYLIVWYFFLLFAPTLVIFVLFFIFGKTYHVRNILCEKFDQK